MPPDFVICMSCEEAVVLSQVEANAYTARRHRHQVQAMVGAVGRDAMDFRDYSPIVALADVAQYQSAFRLVVWRLLDSHTAVRLLFEVHGHRMQTYMRRGHVGKHSYAPCVTKAQ